MKIEIDTDEIVEQIKADILEDTRYMVRREIQETVKGEVMHAISTQLDHVEKTPYNIIHHRIYAMLDKYIEQEIKNRVFEQENK